MSSSGFASDPPVLPSGPHTPSKIITSRKLQYQKLSRTSGGAYTTSNCYSENFLGHVTLWASPSNLNRWLGPFSECLHHVNDRRGTSRAGVITGVYGYSTSCPLLRNNPFSLRVLPSRDLSERTSPLPNPQSLRECGLPTRGQIYGTGRIERPDVRGGQSPFVDFHETSQ